MTNLPAEQRGYGFATFRSHALHKHGSWAIPGFPPDQEPQPNSGLCACGEGYLVSDVYHYHDRAGICHNRVDCHE